MNDENWIYEVPDENDLFGSFPPPEPEPALTRFANYLVEKLSELEDDLDQLRWLVSRRLFDFEWFFVSNPVVRFIRKRLILPDHSNYRFIRERYFWAEDLRRDTEREFRWYEEQELHLSEE